MRRVRLAPGLVGHFAAPPVRVRVRHARAQGRRVEAWLEGLGQGRGRADKPVRYMRSPTHRTPLDEPLKGIDIFAGLGGMSIGAELGGVQIQWAVNHWVEAVRLHAKNMPHAGHLAADAGEIRDWGVAPPHDVMFAGPSCKGFTKAAGVRKLLEAFNKYRATMWTVIEAVEWHLPRYLVVENVPEVLKWNLYPVWRRALEVLGYTITENRLNAPDFGAGMNRERMFIIGVLDGPPLTVTPPADVGPRPWADFVTWNNPQAVWAPIDPGPRSKLPGKEPLKDRWYQAILETHRQLGLRRFVLPYFGTTKLGYSLDRPLGSITTATRYALIDMDTRMMRWPTPREKSLAMGFPANTILPRTKTAGHIMLGNAVAPVVAKGIAEQIEAHRQRWG